MIFENKINITAHAGCMGTEMDSIESIEAGLQYGVDIIEIDLNVDDNGNLVICHDKPKSENKYCRFERVLGIIKSKQNVLLNIDVKNIKALGKIKNTILEYNMEKRVFLTGIDYESIINNKEILREINYFINLETPKLDVTLINNSEYLIGLFNELKLLNIIGINISYEHMTREMMSICSEKGMMSSVWTVDGEEEMVRMINLGVSSITTKKVDILKRLTTF